MDAGGYEWRDPPPSPELGEGEVHVWRASLELSPRTLSVLRSTLSADERRRADRFHFEKDRDQFTAAHGILRTILSSYCDVTPGDLKFREGSHGKPRLVCDDVSASAVETMGKSATIEFNISHSHWLALYVFAQDVHVGVDIECIREDFDWEGIAGRFFHPSEKAALLRLPEPERRAAFFIYWAHKEAYIKGVGEGLSIPTKSFVIRRNPDGSAVVEQKKDIVSNGRKSGASDSGGDSHKSGHASGGDSLLRTSRWNLFELHPAPGYAGAVAVERDNMRIIRWHYTSAE